MSSHGKRADLHVLVVLQLILYSLRLDTIDASGKWPDTEINYATGCDARRANWPAQWHWQRLLVMSAAWHGGLSFGWEDVEQWVGSEELRGAVEKGTQWWFDRDYHGVGCLQDGGVLKLRGCNV